DKPLASLAIERRELGPSDVAIEILYCGVCHSDLHFVRGEWGNQTWPIVPGHEIVGRVSAVGAEVEGVAVGDLAGVGCMVDSCRTCSACRSSAPASPPTRRCATGTSGPTRRSASSASAGSGTWR